MDRIWFVYVNNKVIGPLNTAEAEVQLDQASDPTKALVWWRGQSQWIPRREWTPEKALSKLAVSQKTFYLDMYGENVVGPLTMGQLTERLRSVKDLEVVRIWSDDRKRWGSPFEDAELCRTLGVARRVNTRVPLAGSAVIQKENVQFMASVISVSVGGLGVHAPSAPKVSGSVTLTIRSPSLFNIIKAKADVTYQKIDGTIGMKFVGLSAENQSTLVEYIKNFEAADVQKQTAA